VRGTVFRLAVLGILVGVTSALRAQAVNANNKGPTPEAQLRELFRGTEDAEGPFIPIIRSAKPATAYRVFPLPDLTAEKSVVRIGSSGSGFTGTWLLCSLRRAGEP
jgi:hypothetical protein